MKTALVLLFGFLLFACNRPQSGQESTAPPDSLPAGATDSLVTDSAPLAPEPEPPPLSRLDYDTTQWADIALLDSTILIDMKYATTDNFVQEQMYECGRCFLRPEVAKAVVAAQHELRQQGLGLKMLDCYRPRPIQWKLWEKAPDPRYVSDPRKGSMHNRGAAVDLTLVETSGRELDMGTPYDFFGPEAHPSYTGLPDTVLARRSLLRETLMKQGFHPIRTEWWHFSYEKHNYELSDMLWKCY
ncbi:MAG: M15 family metallopeptidase [Lewinellaceae bacterium]|nr:M15 family metallopeptidase [Lewinellaceae bacterium]